MDRSANRAALIGGQVGRYTVVRHLASGGMAELYVARQEAVGGFEKQLVIKLLQGRYADNPRVVEMFLDEARLAAKLNHPSIVHVYDVAEADGVKFIAMEHIHGETLTDIIRRGVAVGNYLPLEHGVHIISQAAAGLAYAHRRYDLDGAPLRIVHRDVSPSNIMVSYEGQTKIVDFGIARIQDQIREESGMRPGKASYMSPEQVAGEGVDYRSDIFSLGIILYEISLGQRLWRGPAEEVMRRIVEEKIAPPTSVKRDYPPALELIVMRALEKRPADRYQSAEEMRNDLDEFVDEVGFRTGARRMALYLKQLFAPAARVSDEGIARSRQMSDGDGDSGPVVPAADESEELNFDRRASFTMRVEAAPSAPRPSPARPPPAPGSPLDAAAPAVAMAAAAEPSGHRSGTTSGARAGEAQAGAGGAPEAWDGDPLSAASPPRSTSAAEPGAEAVPASSAESRSSSGLTPPQGASLQPAATAKVAAPAPIAAMGAFAPKALSAAVASGERTIGLNVWLTLMVLVLLGIGAMVFIVTK